MASFDGAKGLGQKKIKVQGPALLTVLACTVRQPFFSAIEQKQKQAIQYRLPELLETGLLPCYSAKNETYIELRTP